MRPISISVTGPTRGATESADRSWVANPWLARALRLLLFLVPLVAGWLVVRFVGPFLARPDGTAGALLWFAQAVVLATGVAYFVERGTRRFLPLVALLGMSLSFPDQAPSRFAMALRSGTVRQLQDRIAEANAAGLSSEVQTAAAQAVELVGLLGRHERHTRGHTERVRAYTDLIAVEMGLGVEDRQKLAWAALLHDIGKLSVPPEILNKDGKPTAEEWKILQGHPAAGQAFVEPLANWLGDWRLATSQHHERWDGDGYPFGLRGSNISLAGRIVAVADAYDVITAKRSYKPSMSPEAARRELVDCAGKQFDPDVVRAMLAVSVGSKRTSVWFSWLFEIPGVSTLASGIAAAPAVTVAAVVSLSSAVTVVPVHVAVPQEIAYVEPTDASTTSTTGATTTTIPSEPRGVTTTVRSQEIPFASDPANSTTSTTPTADAATTTTVARSTTTAVPRTTAAPTTTTTSAPTTTTTAAPTTTTTTSPPALTACDRLHNGDTDFAGADLAGCDFAGGSFVGLDLSGANLMGADLSDVTMDSFSMAGANITNAILTDAEFAEGTMAGLTGNNVTAAGARFVWVDLSISSLTNSNLTDVLLNQGSMNAVDLTGTDLEGARVQNLSMDDAVVNFASFKNADVKSVQFNRAIAHDTVFDGANVRFSSFNDSEFDRSSWVGTDARDASLANTRFVNANLSDANFKWARGAPTFTETAIFDETTCPNSVTQNTDCWP